MADLPGAYLFELVVAQGNRSSGPDRVTVSTVNSPPVARAGGDRAVTLGATMTLDAAGSYDRDGDALTFSWSLTQVPAGSAASLSDATALRPQVFIDSDGTYVAELNHTGTASFRRGLRNSSGEQIFP